MNVARTMQGKTVVITGANSGIGKATAIQLARRGATVVMACRDRERGASAMADVKKLGESQAVHLLILDLASFGSVRKFVAEFEIRFRRLDVLVNNAGVVLNKKEVTEDGIVKTFQVNYLSQFLLTNLLLPRLVASAPSRIVNMTSSIHFKASLDFEDLQAKKKYKGSSSYAESKLAMVLFTYELARRLKVAKVTANCVHPGSVATNLARNDAGLLGAAMLVATPFLAQPENGAETPVYLASSPELTQVTGKYFVDKKQNVSSHESYDLLEAKQLWQVSSEMTGLSKPEPRKK